MERINAEEISKTSKALQEIYDEKFKMPKKWRDKEKINMGDCIKAIAEDVIKNPQIFESHWDFCKTLTDADLLPSVPKMVSSIYQLKYDESTRRPMYKNFEQYAKEQFGNKIKADNYSRYWKRKNKEGFSIRQIQAFMLSDYAVYVYEKENKITKIVYILWSSTRKQLKKEGKDYKKYSPIIVSNIA